MLDGDGPNAARAKFSPRFNQKVCISPPNEFFGGLVYGPSRRDGGEINLKGGIFFAELAVEDFKFLPADGGANCLDFSIARRRVAPRRGSKAPKLDDRTDRNVKSAASRATDFG